MKSLDELLEEAKWGKLTHEEIAYVVQRVENCTPSDASTLYILIHILGKAGVVKYQKLIEAFLYYPTHPMISKIALQTLCDFWGFTGTYLSYVKKFIKGVEWDESDNVRDIAISIAGNWLNGTSDPELLEQLISTFDDTTQDCVTRAGAYRAVCKALGLGRVDVRSLSDLIDERRFDEIDFTPIEMAKKRLIAEKS